MNDQTYVIILRLLHIGCGIFWAGSALFFSFFIIPSLKASGPEGVKFMQTLARKGYPVAALITALITIIAGILLIWKISGGFQPIWFGSWYARVLTTSAGMAIIAFLVGFTVNRPAAARVNRISKSVAGQGTPPTPEQMNELMALRKKITVGTNIIAVFLIVAIIGMSVFRYLS